MALVPNDTQPDFRLTEQYKFQFNSALLLHHSVHRCKYDRISNCLAKLDNHVTRCKRIKLKKRLLRPLISLYMSCFESFNSEFTLDRVFLLINILMTRYLNIICFYSKHTAAYSVFWYNEDALTFFTNRSSVSLKLGIFLFVQPTSYLISFFRGRVKIARCHQTAGGWIFTVACFNTVTYNNFFFSVHKQRHLTKKL